MRGIARLHRAVDQTSAVIPSVGTLDDLRAFPVRSDLNGASVIVRDLSVEYWYNLHSTDSDNDETRIQPTVGPGCWCLVQQAGLSGAGDILSTGQAGGQSIQGSSNSTGTLTLSSGSSDPVFVDGDLDADGTVSAAYVRTGDLIMESKPRRARWRFIEHRHHIEVVNEMTGETAHLAVLHPSVIRLLNHVGRILARLSPGVKK